MTSIKLRLSMSEFLSTRAPYDMFNEKLVESDEEIEAVKEEKSSSLASNNRPNDWLHESNLNSLPRNCKNGNKNAQHNLAQLGPSLIRTSSLSESTCGQRLVNIGVYLISFNLLLICLLGWPLAGLTAIAALTDKSTAAETSSSAYRVGASNNNNNQPQQQQQQTIQVNSNNNNQSQQLLLNYANYLSGRDNQQVDLQQQQRPAEADNQARAAQWSLPNRPSLFSIIRFPNEECFDSSNQSGTCYTAFECKLLGGQPSSPCAAGFGSCCIVSRTCHVTTREKVVYFKNPSYPSADSDEKFCDLTVEMSDINVCQLRLDFLDFQLDPPTNGACKDDYMEISASGMPPQTVPRLCGLNRNQHLYITVPQDLSERSASIVFYTDPVGDHRWQVKVTQIDCNHYKPIDWKRNYGKFSASPLWNAHPNAGMKLPLHLMGKYSTTFASGFQTMTQTASALAYEFLKPQFTPRAPMGCLQYFTQPSGIIESFNFGQYLNNMDYSVCIQRQPDTCRVVFTSSDYDWSLNGVGVSGSSSGVGDQDCARDYLMIPGASRSGDGFTYDRYCGGRLHYYRGQTLSAPVVIKTAGPIVLRFHSDGQYEGLNNGGFRLQYEQSAQDCIYHSAEEAGSLSSQQLLASTLADSRPLNQQLGAIIQEAPVMYASQQLSGANQQQQQPIFEQVQHEDQKTLVSPQVSQLSNWHLTNRLNETLASNSVGLSQGNSAESQMIKRNDFVGQPEKTTNSNSALPSDNYQNYKRHLLLADLNKAFQLVTGGGGSGGGSGATQKRSMRRV